MSDLLKSAKLFADITGTIPTYQPPSPGRRRRRLSLSTAIKRAKALGVDVTVTANGSMTFKTSVQNAQIAQIEHDAMSDLDRELEEFEASHEA